MRTPRFLLSGCIALTAAALCIGATGSASPAAASLSDTTAGLVARWPADGTAADVVGGHDGLLRGNAAFAVGIAGQAFALDGDGDFVEVADDPALDFGTGDFTVDLWARFDTTSGEQVLAEKYVETENTATRAGWTLVKMSTNAVRLHLGGGGESVLDSAPLTIPENAWVHFAVRRSDDVFGIFVDGTEVASGTFAVNLDSTASLKLGHRGNPQDTPGSVDTRGFYLDGCIDEVEVYDGALSDQEIASIFTGAFHPWLEVWYPEDRVQMVDWPLDTDVTLTIDDDFDPANGNLYQQDYARGTADRIYAELAGVFDIRPGHVVTVSDGRHVRFHQVTNLVVSGWDVAADTVFGTAAPNSLVQMHVTNDDVNWAWRSTTADGLGIWGFDFSEPGTQPGEQDLLDVEVGSRGAATQPGLLPGESGQTHVAFVVGGTIPPGTSLTTPSHGPATSGTPTVYMSDPLTVSTHGCSGGTATAILTGLDYVQSITLSETSPPGGTYTGTFAPVSTYHGLASISIAITGCDPATTVAFTLYIDPSGIVRDRLGEPVVGATVTLYRSDDPGGSFAAVPDGSSIMGPGNRVNPDLTMASGLFGWDVIAGYYKVRAAKTGCTAPGGDDFAETGVLTIPPPATDLVLVLNCPTTLGRLLGDMVADGRIPNKGVANSIMKQAEKAPPKALTNHLVSLVSDGVITQRTMDQILAMVGR